MYNDLLGKKQKHWSEKKLPKSETPNKEKYVSPNLNVKEKWTNQYEKIPYGIDKVIYLKPASVERLSIFLLKNFPEDLILSASTVDNAIHLLKKALDYEKEVCGECSHKEKLKYLADHDMIKDV